MTMTWPWPGQAMTWSRWPFHRLLGAVRYPEIRPWLFRLVSVVGKEWGQKYYSWNFTMLGQASSETMNWKLIIYSVFFGWRTWSIWLKKKNHPVEDNNSSAWRTWSVEISRIHKSSGWSTQRTLCVFCCNFIDMSKFRFMLTFVESYVKTLGQAYKHISRGSWGSQSKVLKLICDI